jgi:hypothetical protein
MMRTVFMILTLLLATAAQAQSLVVGRFSAGELDDWQTQVFEGETDYRIATDEDGRTALRAVSDAVASGLYREIMVDLTATPWLHWSWKVDNLLQVDELTKAGDDFPARVYVVVSGGALFWRTRSLVYVWSSHQPVGTLWDNPFTGNAKHIAVRSGREGLGRWLEEKRNLREDWRRAFGEDIDRIDGVAIMTDTDNSGQAASAWYGDIGFTGE